VRARLPRDIFLDEVLQGGKAPLQSETDRPQGDAVGQHYVPALHLLSITVKGTVGRDFLPRIFINNPA
jgi:hypothetical protein